MSQDVYTAINTHLRERERERQSQKMHKKTLSHLCVAFRTRMGFRLYLFQFVIKKIQLNMNKKWFCR